MQPSNWLTTGMLISVPIAASEDARCGRPVTLAIAQAADAAAAVVTPRMATARHSAG
ncbi:MAG TPA: hypothetical protein VED43_08500 [Mycobacterium sp.]|nr:hypothetical protein [Mycobacterium sp.]